jgi:hypothetical protein
MFPIHVQGRRDSGSQVSVGRPLLGAETPVVGISFPGICAQQMGGFWGIFLHGAYGIGTEFLS